jgi:hypothetical protein
MLDSEGYGDNDDGKMKWKRRIWEELVVAAGNGTGPGTGGGQGFDFGVVGDNWNSGLVFSVHPPPFLTVIFGRMIHVEEREG